MIENGAGTTYGASNGQGNLIIGYNTNPGTQTGSHNLVGHSSGRVPIHHHTCPHLGVV